MCITMIYIFILTFYAPGSGQFEGMWIPYISTTVLEDPTNPTIDISRRTQFDEASNEYGFNYLSRRHPPPRWDRHAVPPSYDNWQPPLTSRYRQPPPPPPDHHLQRWDDEASHYDERQTRQTPNYDTPHHRPPPPPPYRGPPSPYQGRWPPPESFPPPRESPINERRPRPPPYGNRRPPPEFLPPPYEEPPRYERGPPPPPPDRGPPPPDRGPPPRFSDRPPPPREYDDKRPYPNEHHPPYPPPSRDGSQSRPYTENYNDQSRSILRHQEKSSESMTKLDKDEQNQQLKKSDNSKTEDGMDEDNDSQSMLDVRFADDLVNDVTPASTTDVKAKTAKAVQNNKSISISSTPSPLPVSYRPNFFQVVPVTPTNLIGS